MQILLLLIYFRAYYLPSHPSNMALYSLKPIATLLLILIFITVTSAKRNPDVLCIESEKQALLSFKQDLVDPLNTLSSWAADGDDCCEWNGVVCDNITGHVKQLLLDDGALSGKVNPSLLNLTHLTHLDMSRNDFIGTQIPNFIGALMSLKYLNLTQAGFGGKIPHQLGNLSSLSHLILGSATYVFTYTEKLYADNLHWLSGLSSLKSLVMEGVNLSNASDHWLFAINTLPSLLELSLPSCQLSHIRLPSPLNLTSLVRLDLSYNSLELGGPIPCTFRNNMSHLRYLDLSGNYMGSVIPSCFYSFPSLEHLDLSQSELQGTISSDLANLTSIVSLDLSANALTGKIPTSMGKLCNLEEFDLTGNEYKGSVSMVFECLSGCSAKKLKSLQLGGNLFDSFTGQISDEIRAFENLADLDLGSNKFSGPIPMSILEKLISLKKLNLSSNNFSGPLPESFASLSKLESLRISDNQLSGPLPKSLGSLSNLESLDIESNNFEGDVSEVHFSNLTKLTRLYASGNKLSMKVGLEWTPPFSLTVLQLRDWNLGPQLPIWMKSQKNIYYIDMSNTGILDVIPCWFWNFSSHLPKTIDLSENQIYGEIPDFSNDGSYLLNLSFNKLTGPLPRIPIDSMLDLSNNYLSGNLSNFLCNPMTYRRTMLSLNLENNFLSGNIPDCWMYWPSLRMIELDNNKLTGIIPSSIGFLRNLTSLHLRNNNLIGEIPEPLKNCSTLSGLDLGFNKLVGSIPRWIKCLSKLNILVLRSNNFSGVLPSELCELSTLQVLDVSNNSLTGIIPKCLKKFKAMTSISHRLPLTMLGIGNERSMENANLVIKGKDNHYKTILFLLSSLDLSSNNFFGEIPEELTSLQALQSLNLSGNHFRGSIPETINNLTDLESLDLSRNRLSGHIPSGMASITFLSFLNLSYNNLSGQIPTSTQLQTMDASGFIGNKLCGPPLLIKCREDHVTLNRDASTEDGDRQDDEYWFRLGIGMGFGVSFVGVIVPLLVCGFWRRAYFWFFEEYLWYKFVDYFIKVKYMF